MTLFLAFLMAQGGAMAIAYVRGAIYADDLQHLLVRLLTIYSVPLGVIIGGIFAHDSRAPERLVGTPFWAALVMASAWNLLLMFRTIVFMLSAEDSMASLAAYFDAVSAAGLFLVGGALAYFFARRETS